MHPLEHSSLRPRVAMLAALAVFVAASALAAEAPATLPDTLTGRRAAALLQVWASGARPAGASGEAEGGDV